jgi:hypothetical protein
VESFFEPSLSWMQVNEGRGYAYQRSSFGPEFMLMTGLVPIFLWGTPSTESAAFASDEGGEETGVIEFEDDGRSQSR